MNHREAQAALLSLGFFLGTTGPKRDGVDGDWGATSRKVCAAFQASRGLPATGELTAETVKALQAAVAERAEPRVAPAPTTVSARGLAEILAHEALVTAPYRDSVGVWTIGVGHTKAAGGPDPAALAKGVQRPVAEMIAIFRQDLPKYEVEVRAAVKLPLQQHEFDALVSFHFNTGAIGRASFVDLLNRGDRVGAAKGIMAWNKPAEIIGRRRAEQTLFRDGTYSNDGAATVYPASASGAVQWRKGKRVPVADLL